MRTTYHYIENEDGMLPVEVELVIDYQFYAEVKETRGSYSGDTPGEPAYIGDIELVVIGQVKIDDHLIMPHDKKWLTKLFTDRMEQNKAFMETLTEFCEEDYYDRHMPHGDEQ